MSNPNIPILNNPIRYVNNLMLAWQSNTKVAVVVGAARDNNDLADIIISQPGGGNSDPLNILTTFIDSTKIGAGGLDTGVLAASTNYYVFVIGDSTGNRQANAIFSDNNIVPLLPTGYDIFRRIGYVRTDGSKNFLKWYQFGRGVDRWYWYDVAIQVLSGGSATTFTPVDMTDAMPFVPLDGESEVKLLYTYTPASATNTAQFHTANSTQTTGIVQISGGVAAAQTGVIEVPCESSEINYKVQAGDTLSLSVIGFKDYLSAPQ